MANPEYKTITAQYNGECSICGNAIERGDKIKYAKGRPTIHADCKAPEVPADAIHLNGGEGYGCQGWTPQTVAANPGRRAGSSHSRGYEEIKRRLDQWIAAHPKPDYDAEVLALVPKPHPGLVGNEPDYFQKYSENGKVFRQWKGENPEVFAAFQLKLDIWEKEEREAKSEIQKSLPDNDGPEFLFVLTASRRYIREDGMSFGVGDEQGYVYSAVCRPATDEESKPLREEIAREQARREAGSKLKDLCKQVRDQGEYPEGSHDPEGNRINIGEGQNIYGGGSWFVIGPEWIWYVRNNGHDGDDWSANNVGTGGAGAIGIRIRFDQLIADQIRDLTEATKGENRVNS